MTTITPTNLPNQSTQNNYTVKIVDGCKDISDIFQIFDSYGIREEIDDTGDTLLININIDQHFEALSASDHQKLAKICKNKSIVVLLTSKADDKFLIYWK